MNITGVSRTVYPPFGPALAAPPPIRWNFTDADAGTLIVAPAAAIAPGLPGMPTPRLANVAVDPDAGTLILPTR